MSFNTAKKNAKINEKTHNQQLCSHDLSQLMHGSFGLDHYPNYLLRWNLDEIENLESIIQSQLERIKYQKSKLSNIVSFTSNFNGILNNLNNHKLTFSEILHPNLLPYLTDKKTGKLRVDWNFMAEILIENEDVSTNTVFSFPLLNPKFCDLIIQHASQYYEYIAKNSDKLESKLDDKDTKDKDKKDSKNNLLLTVERPVLDWMQLGWLNDYLLNEIVNPIALLVYQNELFYNCLSFHENDANGNNSFSNSVSNATIRKQNAKVNNKHKNNNNSNNNSNSNSNSKKRGKPIRVLNWRHGYLVGYSTEIEQNLYDMNGKNSATGNIDYSSKLYRRTGLVKHSDDADITLNICLNDKFTGGNLNIYTMRGEEYISDKIERKQQQIEKQKKEKREKAKAKATKASQAKEKEKEKHDESQASDNSIDVDDIYDSSSGSNNSNMNNENDKDKDGDKNKNKDKANDDVEMKNGGNDDQDESYLLENDPYFESAMKLEKGYAILHPGRQIHEVTSIKNGKRVVLILWTRNNDDNSLRNEICPCCWMNRRADYNCVCGPVWN